MKHLRCTLLAAAAAICFFMPCAGGEIIAEFKKPSDISRWMIGRAAAFTLAPWPDGTPGLSGKVTFKSKRSGGERWPQISLFFDKPRSWSRYKELRFKLRAVTAYKGLICIVSADKKGFRNYHYVDLAPGWHTVSVDLDNMKKHNVDLEQVSRLILFTSDPPEDIVFHVDKLELIPRDTAPVLRELKRLRKELNKLNPAVAKRAFAEIDARKKDDVSPADCDKVRAALQQEKMRRQQRLLAPTDKEPIVLRWASSLEKVHQTKMYFSEMPLKEVEIQAAQGEGESLQLVVQPKNSLTRASVRISKLPVSREGKLIPASALSIAPVGFVRCDPPRYKVDRNGYWPDPILNYAKTVFIRSRQWQSWFLDINIPANQAPGLYKGEVEFKARGQKPRYMQFSVRVRNFDLGKKIPYPMSFSVPASDDEQLDDILIGDLRPATAEKRSAWRRKCYDVLLRNKLGADTLYRRGHLGLVPLEEIRYRLENGMNHYSLFNLGFWPQVGMKRCGAEIAELKRQGLLDRAMFYGYDEIHPERFAEMRKALKKVRAVYSDIPILTTAYDTSFGKETGFDGLINGYIPTTAEFEAQLPAIRAAQKAGKRVWWYCAFAPYHPYPNFLIEYPAIEARLLMGLMFWKMKPEGFLYYQVASWRDFSVIDHDGRPTFRKHFMSGAPITDWNAATMRDNNGDGCLVYPGPQGLIETLRLKAIRDGIEDYMYLRLLENALEKVESGKAVMPAQWCSSARKELTVEKELVTSMTVYTHDIRAVAAKRSRIAGLLETYTARSGNPKPVIPPYSLKRSLWKEFEKK